MVTSEKPVAKIHLYWKGLDNERIYTLVLSNELLTPFYKYEQYLNVFEGRSWTSPTKPRAAGLVAISGYMLMLTKQSQVLELLSTLIILDLLPTEIKEKALRLSKTEHLMFGLSNIHKPEPVDIKPYYTDSPDVINYEGLVDRMLAE